MNSNLIRTIIAVLTVAVGAVSAVFNCDVTGTVCKATFLSPVMIAYITMGLGLMHLLLKGLNGIAGLVNPVAVVSETGKPGTVPPEQVN